MYVHINFVQCGKLLYYETGTDTPYMYVLTDAPTYVLIVSIAILAQMTTVYV